MFHIWEYYLHSLTSDRTHTVVQLFQTKTSQVDFNLEAVWGSLTKRLKNLFIWLTCPVFIDQKLTKTRRMKSTEYDQHRRLHLKISNTVSMFYWSKSTFLFGFLVIFWARKGKSAARKTQDTVSVWADQKPAVFPVCQSVPVGALW